MDLFKHIQRRCTIRVVETVVNVELCHGPGSDSRGGVITLSLTRVLGFHPEEVSVQLDHQIDKLSRQEHRTVLHHLPRHHGVKGFGKRTRL
jgi:hypothetical protein